MEEEGSDALDQGGPGPDLELRKHVAAKRDVYIARLAEVVAIPGVSAELGHRQDLQRTVDWVASWCRQLGGVVTVEDLGSHEQADGTALPLPPVLLAQFGSGVSGGQDSGKRKPTLLVYGHLDVQPARESDGWASDPFSLAERQGRLYGRGSTDDKGPVCAWLWAVEAFQELGRELPVDLRFLFECMEESGSVGLSQLCRRLAVPGGFLDPTAVDFVCISDSYWSGRERPCLTHSLRGSVKYELEVQGSTKELHSGCFGGLVHEAMTDLVRLLASLVDSQGKILVEGIYEQVKALSDKERQALLDADLDLEGLPQDAGVRGVSDRLVHATKDALLLHRWRMPTLSLHGISGAHDGEGFKTVIPGKVVGKFSLRTVPNMRSSEVDALVRRHVQKEWEKLGSPNRMQLRAESEPSDWWMRSFEDDANFRAAAAAIRRAHGCAQPCYIGEGGSIPITGELEELCQASCVLLPLGACDDNAHGVGEKFDVANYLRGVEVMAAYFQELAAAV